MELPEYGNTNGIKLALLEVRAQLSRKEREVKSLLAVEAAIRSMCKHKMVSDGDARMPTSSCEHCGHVPGSHRHFTVYGS